MLEAKEGTKQTTGRCPSDEPGGGVGHPCPVGHQRQTTQTDVAEPVRPYAAAWGVWGKGVPKERPQCSGTVTRKGAIYRAIFKTNINNHFLVSFFLNGGSH